MVSKILILGSGFLGSQLKKDLGQNVVGVSRTGLGDIRADLKKENNYKLLPLDVNYVIYAVSPDDSSLEAYKRAYIDILKLSLSYCANLSDLKKLILVSSTGVYGENSGGWVNEESFENPRKETSKIILEAEKLVHASSLPYVILRFGGIYGPGRERMLKLAQAKSYDLTVCEYSNRIHVEDCSQLIQFSFNHLEGLFIGVDSKPSDKREVLNWLRAKQGLEIEQLVEPNKVLGKRCSNKKILNHGYTFKYQSYQEGYTEILKDWKC